MSDHDFEPLQPEGRRPSWQFLGQMGLLMLGSLVLAVSSGQLALTFETGFKWFMLSAGCALVAILLGYALIFANERCYIHTYPVAGAFFVLSLGLYLVGLVYTAWEEKKTLGSTFWGTVIFCGAGVAMAALFTAIKMVQYFRAVMS